MEVSLYLHRVRSNWSGVLGRRAYGGWTFNLVPIRDLGVGIAAKGVDVLHQRCFPPDTPDIHVT